MINALNNLFIFLLLLIPLFLVTGPAIPDIVVTFSMIFGLLVLIKSKNKFFIINNNLTKISFLFWFSLIFVSFFAIDKERSFEDSIIFIRFLLVPIFIYFIFFINENSFKKSLLIIFLLCVLISIDTMYQFINYTSEYGFGNDLLGFSSNWYGRLTGPFGDELVPGAFISKFGLIGYAFIISNKTLKNNLLVEVIYLGLILVVCFASGERMAFATYCMSLCVLLLFLNKRRKAIILTILFGGFLIFSIYKLHPFYNDYRIIESNEYHQGLKIEKIFKCEDNPNKLCTKIINVQPGLKNVLMNFSTSAYGEIYLLAFKMFRDNPFTGIGISNFEYTCNNIAKYKNMMQNYNCASHPHNIYIQWLTEGGLITFLIFIVYMLILSLFIFRNKGSYENRIISLAVILIMFWPIMSTGSLIKNWNGVLTFYVISLCLCLSRLKKSL